MRLGMRTDVNTKTPLKVLWCNAHFSLFLVDKLSIEVMGFKTAIEPKRVLQLWLILHIWGPREQAHFREKTWAYLPSKEPIYRWLPCRISKSYHWWHPDIYSSVDLLHNWQTYTLNSHRTSAHVPTGVLLQHATGFLRKEKE